MRNIPEILNEAEKNGATYLERATVLYLCAKKHIDLLENEYVLREYYAVQEQIIGGGNAFLTGFDFLAAYSAHNSVLSEYNKKYGSFEPYYSWCTELAERVLAKYLNK